MQERIPQTQTKPELVPLSGETCAKMSDSSGNLQQTLAAITVTLVIFSTGMSVGWPSPVGPILKSADSPLGYSLSDEDMSWLTSITFFASIFGTFFWGRIADVYGRKMAAYSISIPFIIGWALTVFCSSKTALLLSRISNGLSGAGAFIISPLYIAEIAHDNVRGTLSSFVILSFNAGIVAVYTFGAVYSYRILNLICLAVPFIFISLFYWFPESPIYLWSKGKEKEAEAALMCLRGGNLKLVQAELNNYAAQKKDVSSVTLRSLFNCRGKKMAMIIALGLFAWQQFCGIPVILTYTSTIFIAAESSITPHKATVLVGLFQLSSSFLSSIILQKTPRKFLLLTSYFLMGVAHSAIGTYFFFKLKGADVSDYGWVPVSALSLHVLIYALGAGPVPFVVFSETLYPEVRNLATTVIIFWSSVLVSCVVKIFPTLEAIGGMHGALWVFAFFCFVAFLFTLIVVPETKGIPLQDVLRSLNGESQNDDCENMKKPKVTQFV